MIIRVFQAMVPPESQGAFEARFREVSVPLTLRQKGLHSVTIGRPTEATPDRFLMISVWEDEDAIAGFVGPDWSQPHIPPGMEQLIGSCSVDHFETIDTA